jgi:predicted transcriptional regulator
MLDEKLLKLNLSELRAYLVLADEKKDMNATEVATKLKIQRAMTSRTLNILYRFGLIHKYRRHRVCFFSVIGGR